MKKVCFAILAFTLLFGDAIAAQKKEGNMGSMKKDMDMDSMKKDMDKGSIKKDPNAPPEKSVQPSQPPSPPNALAGGHEGKIKKFVNDSVRLWIGSDELIRAVYQQNLDHSSPLKKALLTGFHSTAKHNATKAVSPSSETMRTI